MPKKTTTRNTPRKTVQEEKWTETKWNREETQRDERDEAPKKQGSEMTPLLPFPWYSDNERYKYEGRHLTVFYRYRLQKP